MPLKYCDLHLSDHFVSYLTLTCLYGPSYPIYDILPTMATLPEPVARHHCPLPGRAGPACKALLCKQACFASGTGAVWLSFCCCPDTSSNLTEHYSDSWASSEGVRISWNIAKQIRGGALYDWRSTCQEFWMMKWTQRKLKFVLIRLIN